VKIGIDFVSDPIVGQDDGEDRSSYPQSPAKPIPDCTRGEMERDVYKIGGGVASVGEQGEDGHEEEGSERQSRAKMGPGGDDPRKGDDEEDKVIEEAAGFPKAGGIGEERAEGARG
jgi:hypothetical protein